MDIGKGLWQDVVRAKYLKRSSIANIKGKFNDSPFWKALLKVKETYMAGRRVVVNSGDVARLWHDPIGTQPPLRVT